MVAFVLDRGGAMARLVNFPPSDPFKPATLAGFFMPVTPFKK
jgi:hypothetical protein